MATRLLMPVLVKRIRALTRKIEYPRKKTIMPVIARRSQDRFPGHDWFDPLPEITR